MDHKKTKASFRKTSTSCSWAFGSVPARSKEIASSPNHFLVGWLFFFLDRVPCNQGWRQTPDPPASGSLVLGFQVHITTLRSPALSEVILHILTHFILFLIIHLGDHQPGNVLPAGKGTDRTEIWTARLSP